MPSLSEFFDSPAAIPVSGRPVSFRAIRRTVRPGQEVAETLAADVRAVLFFVDETERAAAHRDADACTNSKLKPGESAPDNAREDERVFHVLFRALRIAESPHTPLCRTVDELRGALVLPAVQDLWSEYLRFVAEEFPPYVDPEEFVRLVEAAKKKPLPALLEDFDSDTVRRSLLSLANLLLRSGTRT